MFPHDIPDMELSRREMLASTSFALLTAGCISSSPDPRLTLDASVTKAPTAPLSFDVAVPQATISDDVAGNLAVTYQNHGNKSRTLRLVPQMPHPQTSKAESPGIVLEHPEFDIKKEKPGCWMPAADSVSSRLGLPQYELGEGEQVKADYQVWAHPQGKPEYTSLKSGTYRVPMPESTVLAVELAET